MVEELYVAVGVASFELMLAILQQAQQRQSLSLQTWNSTSRCRRTAPPCLIP